MAGTTPTPPPEGSPFEEDVEPQPADDELLSSLVVEEDSDDSPADDGDDGDDAPKDDPEEKELIEELLPVEPDRTP
jgi:hypothetical protein